MSITVEWHNPEQSVLQLTFSGSWNWDELYRAIDVSQQMSAGKTHRVDAILDLSKAATLPAGFFLTPSFRNNAQKLAKRATGKHGRIAVVGANSWIVSMYGMFRGLLGNKAGTVYFVDSLSEAQQRLTGNVTGPAPSQPTPAEAA
jgi:hypothetical protein